MTLALYKASYREKGVLMPLSESQGGSTKSQTITTPCAPALLSLALLTGGEGSPVYDYFEQEHQFVATCLSTQLS